MMRTVVVYRSKTGFAERYARWIAEELGADLFTAPEVTVQLLTTYDTIVYGAGLYAIGINGIKLIKDHLGQLAGKKIAVFATGASPGRPEEVAGVVQANFTPEQLERIRFFYFRGGFDAGKLTVTDRLLMTLLKWKLKWRRQSGNLSPDERGMLHAYDRPVDFTRKSNIIPLVAYCRSED